ncbi:mucin-associated surface protein (MASP) [Trypanosoma cruzi Dm28c]|uniref:Mucin-associated surface protein (MASP) n=2 Tax=Trypanosoma cruzi TaxID=5693 RepID=V5BI02_TRYCR|nr:mucin-associated surface protein (MASP) [Trypanosoma cruzi Dm28c]PBJ74827.1 mucin-associated surface protein [Trypanosoma cruzi cruzi]PWU84884.1 Mucin-associated surface protein (MASP) [Trypanosoma cruzi]
MAMMVTGRVLLVCALCVLWCGAGGGYAWDFGSNDTLNEYYYGANGVFCKIFPKMYSCELKINASKAALQKSTAQSGEVSGQSNAGGSPGGQDQTLKENGSDQSQGDAGTQLQKPGETPPEAPTQPSTESEDLPRPAAANGSEAPGTTTELQSPPHSQLPAGGTTATPIGDGSSGRQGNSSEENGLGQPEGDAGTHASQPPNGNETETPTPATPPATVTVAAQTSATRTPDESDGSTAASHTTSPLLLLVFVVCAAAAAVVAA